MFGFQIDAAILTAKSKRHFWNAYFRHADLSRYHDDYVVRTMKKLKIIQEFALRDDSYAQVIYF